MEELRTNFDVEYNFKAKDKREGSKKPVSGIDFSGLLENNGSEAEDEDAEDASEELDEDSMGNAEDEDGVEEMEVEGGDSEEEDDGETYSVHSGID